MIKSTIQAERGVDAAEKCQYTAVIICGLLVSLPSVGATCKPFDGPNCMIILRNMPAGSD